MSEIILRRNTKEVEIDVLKLCATKPKGIGRTHIMYGANLSWDKLIAILPSMLSRGILRELKTADEDRDKWERSRGIKISLTPKGWEALKVWKTLEQIMMWQNEENSA